MEIEGKKYMMGHTKEYLKVAVEGENLTKKQLSMWKNFFLFNFRSDVDRKKRYCTMAIIRLK